MNEPQTDIENDEQRAQRILILDRLGLNLSAKRRDAIAARLLSGIERSWQEDEEYYQGYDDANRHEFAGTNQEKPTESGGQQSVKRDPTKSTVFPNITSHYVDAAAARVSDTLLPTDDSNYAFEPTPIPDLIGNLQEEGAEVPPNQMMQLQGQQVQVAKVVEEVAKIKAEAQKRCDKAQERVDDWLSECQYHAHGRKVIHETAKLGTGVMKGPVPVGRRRKTWNKDEKTGDTVLQIVEEIKPASFYVSVWNLFPDESCGENIHNGSHIFERDYLSERKLAELKGLPGYLDDQIDLCIQEGPGVYVNGSRVDNQGAKRTAFEIWYFHGILKRDEMVAAGCECEEDQESVHAMITMVNDRVIRASINPLDSGEFPYDVMRWKRRTGHWAGVGVARQVRTPQRIVVAGARNLMQNSGASARPHRVVSNAIKQSGSDPFMWEISSDAEIQEVQKAMLFWNVPSMQAELMNIIKFGMDLAERETGLPMLLQGQQGSAPDTARGTEILNNNANSMLRNVALIFDDDWTVPHMGRYYDWLMAYSEDENEKPDATIVARGSTALVEKDMQTRSMVTVIQLCQNPIFEKSPKRAMDVFLKSMRFDPAAFDYTPEELKEIRERPPQVAPVVQAAQVRADSLMQVEKMQSKEEADHAVADASLEMARQRFDADESAKDRALEQMRMEMDAQLAGNELSSDERVNLERQKVLLASLTLKLQTQRQLSQESIAHSRDVTTAGHLVDLHKTRQVVTPPSEPVGRAENGAAFQQ